MLNIKAIFQRPVRWLTKRISVYPDSLLTSLRLMHEALIRVVALLTLLVPLHFSNAQWLRRIPLTNGSAVVEWQAGERRTFLRFGAHTYEPSRAVRQDGPELKVQRTQPIVIAPFEELEAVTWEISGLSPGSKARLDRPLTRDEFWDQILEVDTIALGPLPRYRVIETGRFGAALPPRVRDISLTAAGIAQQQESLTDPVIPANLTAEMPWTDIESKAFPLDFQKVLLASLNEESPAFAFQNGQWFTTWPSHGTQWTKEDNWFAPALLVGKTLVRPAPLSARTSFLRTPEGRTLPCWTLTWSYEGITVYQELFSLRAGPSAGPGLRVRFRIRHARPGVRLAIGMGRRPSAHYWDDRALERTPIPFFTVPPRYRLAGNVIRDERGAVVLVSGEHLVLESLGPVEMLAVFTAGPRGDVYLQVPQTPDSEAAVETSPGDFNRAKRAFLSVWRGRLGDGAQAQLPSPEWMERIDAWRSQVESITRVRYDGKERLSYGAYFYQAYFGIEEAWPVVALALWGRRDEAERQAGIMLEPENLSKENIHHQSRNGAAPAAAAAVARLTNDRTWLESVASTLIDCARWTERVREENSGSRSAVTRGLLPPHIYGGDVRDPATSLYATVACWHGMAATAEALGSLGTPSVVSESRYLDSSAHNLRARLCEVIRTVADRTSAPPFLPFALELPSLGGKNEGPHPRITGTKFGNYWNLFAPSFLELDFRGPDDEGAANEWVNEYAGGHGGLWAGLPRFYDGLDAAYAIGNISYLLTRAENEISFRPRALASLESFMLHGASRNGFTVPEVAGLFPYRLDRAAYEQLTREAPWSFGMYDAGRYLGGHISFTEPLGAAAGEFLWLIRRALLSETFDSDGHPDGGLVLLPCIPSEWLAEGKVIRLRSFPTYYGTISLTVRSLISSGRKVIAGYRFVPYVTNKAATQLKFRLRLSPPGERVREITFVPDRGMTSQITARW